MSINRKIAMKLLCVGLMLGLLSCTTFRESESDPATTSIDEDGYTVVSHASLSSLDMTFAYKYNGANNIDIKVSASTDHTQWVGIGFNSTGRMSGADFKVGHWTNTGYTSSSVEDKKAEGYSAPSNDTIDSLAATDMQFSSGITTMTFTMPLADDANGQDHELQKGGTVSILLAYGPYSVGMGKHTAKGSFELQLDEN